MTYMYIVYNIYIYIYTDITVDGGHKMNDREGTPKKH